MENLSSSDLLSLLLPRSLDFILKVCMYVCMYLCTYASLTHKQTHKHTLTLQEKERGSESLGAWDKYFMKRLFKKRGGVGGEGSSLPLSKPLLIPILDNMADVGRVLVQVWYVGAAVVCHQEDGGGKACMSEMVMVPPTRCQFMLEPAVKGG